MILHHRKVQGNRTLSSASWGSANQYFQGIAGRILYPSASFSFKEHFGRSQVAQDQLSGTPWLGWSGQSRSLTSHSTAGAATGDPWLGWAGLLAPGWRLRQGALKPTAQQGRGREGRGGQASKGSVFQNHTHHHSSAVLQGAFWEIFIGIMFPCSGLAREHVPSSWGQIGNANLTYSSLPFQNQMISCGFSPAKFCQI